MPGTDLAYNATQHPVLNWRMVLDAATKLVALIWGMVRAGLRFCGASGLGRARARPNPYSKLRPHARSSVHCNAVESLLHLFVFCVDGDCGSGDGVTLVIGG